MKWSRALARPAAWASLGALIASLALMAWLIPLSTARAASLDASSPVTIDIQNPQASGGVVEGPVGANIFAQGAAPAGDSVTIGYAPQSVGCASGFQAISGAQPNIQANGNFTVAFQWPDAANTVNTEYYLCAQDTTANAIGQSTVLYRVDAASAPAISVQPVDNPNAATPAPGTPTPAPTVTPPDGKVYGGGYPPDNRDELHARRPEHLVLPDTGGVHPSDYNPDAALTVVSGNIRTDNTGGFTVVVRASDGRDGLSDHQRGLAGRDVARCCRRSWPVNRSRSSSRQRRRRHSPPSARR